MFDTNVYSYRALLEMMDFAQTVSGWNKNFSEKLL